MNEGLGNPGEGRHGDDTSGSGTSPEGTHSTHPGSTSDGTSPNPSADGMSAAGGDEPRTPGGHPASGTHPAPDEPLAAEEEAIRRLLRDSVRDLEPSEDSLDHLRRAVPARKTHRRQALVGAVAAALVAVVGVPTLLYGGVVPGIGDDKHPLTASSSQGQTHGPDGGTGEHDGESGDKTGKDGKGEGKDKDGKGKGSAEPSPSGGPGNGSADPSETLTASAPTCGRDQLGEGSAQTGEPDGQGKVYGSFRVTNTSGDACTVEGEGMVGANVQGGSERARVAIMDHTPGDPAPGLGDPAAASDELVLRPGASYLVKFAWVPKDGGSGCSSDSPSPKNSQANNEVSNPDTAGGTGGDDSAGGDSGGGAGGTGTTPGEGSAGTGDPGNGSGEPSVVVSHTPEVGSPAAAGTKLDGACGGTVYRTGVLPAS
ncbi:DUF4232 domain-containing protein [Streptomyces iconiensis]|uniref:DUF4232 domain-containing protein n=1 Tax=Streptomyces iconiensis TaxID=1384038 RepID=A0ABT6ZS32_9ACTN|nr:DUF4232 domain-containing protein [Streptomyces iconiensis]MDJ1131865.1 DUF4232 domain-containing protein [Streptomyces iconiensis]